MSTAAHPVSPSAGNSAVHRCQFCAKPDFALNRFAFDKANLQPFHLPLIRKLAAVIMSRSRTGLAVQTIVITGHTDSQGPANYNVSLGSRRASAVRLALSQELNRLRPGFANGVRFQVRSVGESKPVAPSTTQEGRALNRRVEILFLPRRRRPVPPQADAQAQNRRLAKSLGWQAYRFAISKHLGFLNGVPDESAFVTGVRQWQRKRGLPASGVLDARSLAVLRTEMKNVVNFPGDQPGSVSAQEQPTDSSELRQFERDLQHEAGAEADRFFTEAIGSFPEGHQSMVRKVALAVGGMTAAEIAAMADVQKVVDQWSLSLNPSEQKRHFLRREVCQRIPDAWSETINHLKALYGSMLAEPVRLKKFSLIGECLHLIQDSFSSAHTERSWGGVGGRHPILFIRFFGVKGLPFPVEHRTLPPDPRDTVSGVRKLTTWAAEAITASIPFVQMALRHIGGSSSTASADLNAYINRHLPLDPGHTPTSHFYPRPICP